MKGKAQDPWESIVDPLWGSLLWSLGTSLSNSLRPSIGISLWNPILISLSESLIDSLWNSLGASLRAHFGN